MRALNYVKLTTSVSAILLTFGLAQAAQAETINVFGGASSWFESDMRGNGTAEIVDLTGAGGNLENNAPLPTGAAKLTTGFDNGDKAQVSTIGDFGTVGEFLNGGSLSYSYFKESVVGGNASAAAAIKLTVYQAGIDAINGTNADDLVNFIYEPYWNENHNAVGSPATVGSPVADAWKLEEISGTDGYFWVDGMYTVLNQAGGPGYTISDWASSFGSLVNAVIVGISVGIGTYNQGQIAYFDDVRFNSGSTNLAYDFEAAVIPVPAALPLLAGGLGVLGFAGWRRRRQATA